MGEGFSLWSLAPMALEGREPLRDWIYLSVSTFSDSTPSPFLLYLEIRNSDWGESFAQIFLIKLAFLRQKKSVNRLTGVPREPRPRPGGRARPPVSWPPRTLFRVDSSSRKSQIFQINSPSVFIPFGLRLICFFCETKNMQLKPIIAFHQSTIGQQKSTQTS